MQTSRKACINLSLRYLCKGIPSCRSLGLTSTKLCYLVANFGVC